MTVVIELTQGKTTIIDDCDVDLAQLGWCAIRDPWHYYAARSLNPGMLRLHRVIMERVLGRSLEKHEQIDHINGDGLDNRRENLRVATNAENARNRKRHSNNTSGYRGVFFDKARGRWRAVIRVNGRKKHLGYFDTPEEAGEAHREAARLYYGEFANTEETDRERTK